MTVCFHTGNFVKVFNTDIALMNIFVINPLAGFQRFTLSILFPFLANLHYFLATSRDITWYADIDRALLLGCK